MRLITLAFFSFAFLSYRLFLSYSVPHVWPDEVLFFNPAYELFKNGVLRTSVLEGLIPGMENLTLWMPPLYMIALSLWFHLGWIEIESARLFSSIIGLGCIFLIQSFLLPRYYNKKFKFISIIPVVFILTDILFLNVSQTSRMETLCALFGIGGISLALNRHYFFTGITLGLSFLSHPFGVFYSIPIIYLTFANENLRSIRIFIRIFLGGIIPIACWGFYVVPNWDIFLIQFGAQLTRKSELLAVFGFIDRLKILVYSYPFSILKLLLIGLTLIISIFSLRNPALKKSVSLYIVWFVAMSIGFYLSSEFWYAIHIVFPLSLLVLSIFLNSNFRSVLFDYWKNFNWNPKIIPVLFLLFIISYQLFSVLWYILSHSYIESARDKTDAFFKLVEQQALPHDSIYLQLIPDPYFHLRKVYPEKKLYAFIPGELSIDNENLNNTWEKIDLFLFYNDSLMNSSLSKYLIDNPEYTKEVFAIPYRSHVPGRGDWKIISYSRREDD